MRLRLPHLVALLFALLLWVPAKVWAADAHADGNKVIVNRQSTLAFQRSGSGLSPTGRAAALARNLGRGNTWPVTVRRTKRTAKIIVGGRVLVVVSREDAAAERTTASILANRWASALRSALSLPALKLGAEGLTLPPAATRAISLVGSKARYAQFQVSPPGALLVTPNDRGFELKTVATGESTVEITAGEASVRLVVSVLPYAAVLPQQVTASVTGAPADESTVRGSIQGALNLQLVGQPEVRWHADLPTGLKVPSAEARSFNIRVRAEAPNSFPVQGTVTALVRNVPVGGMRESELWYCNNPENIRRSGPLFAAKLKKASPVRLLYHHVNGTTQALVLRVQLVNDTDQEAKIAITPGDSEPDRNPVLAGFRAGDQFVRSWVTGSGEIYTIPPHSVLPVSVRRISPGETASGLCSLRLIDGPDELDLRTDSIPPFPTDRRWANALLSSAPWREISTRPIQEIDLISDPLTRHTYPNPFREEEATYKVGGRHSFIRIGQKPIPSTDNAGRLDGNFGVIYQIRATAQNPTPEPADVEVVFEASAGYTGGLFFVDGKYVKTRLLQPKGEQSVARFRLAPGASRTLRILTLPLSGGSYPVTLTVRAVGTLMSNR
ncbi:MAG: hypothetical protein ACOYON_11710 [Fimbriimonas sp.]